MVRSIGTQHDQDVVNLEITVYLISHVNRKSVSQPNRLELKTLQFSTLTILERQNAYDM